MRPCKPRSAGTGVAALLIACTVTIALDAALADPTVLPGYYYTLPLKRTPSTDFSFDVNRGGNVAYVILVCGPVSAKLESTLRAEHVSNIEVHGPKLKLNRAGGFSYDGVASISGRPRSGTLGTTTLRITATHVEGPTIRYQNQHQTQTATRSFVGTATSPACIRAKIARDPHGTPLYRGGRFQLYF